MSHDTSSATVLPTVTSSPQAAIPSVQHRWTPKYPWRTMNVGTSFIVPYGQAKLKTLIPYAWRVGKKLDKKFRVIDHGKDIGYEVARLK